MKSIQCTLKKSILGKSENDRKLILAFIAKRVGHFLKRVEVTPVFNAYIIYALNTDARTYQVI